ncbi:acetylpolyamine amidohydrolase [Desulfovibrio inopinatus]|uniref:acetylpolyamine amidohydrolase n=1 Tax=Desulfovibrio inopinatus TaxID=102109 RepID=UPI000413AF75|nr:acetylpolyamine amidohydrolase [Desulfovibrio inopinatus]
MFRIRRILDDLLPIDRSALTAVADMMAELFPAGRTDSTQTLAEKLKNPFKTRFRSIVLIAEDNRHKIRGFALLLSAPDEDFCYLDFLGSHTRLSGRGVGAALYQRVRQEAAAICRSGLFFECLPDDPLLCADADLCQENGRRLRFYERYGAFPIVGTRYETPVEPGGDCPPYLVYDNLGRTQAVSAKKLQIIVRAILERKYGDVCSKDYITDVVASFTKAGPELRPPRYQTVETVRSAPPGVAATIGLTVNDRHDIHHVKERGYVEAPARINAILKSLEPTGLFERLPVREHGESAIVAVHDAGFAGYLKRMCMSLPETSSLYPYVFPIRNQTRPPKEMAIRAGYYCIDTFTPLNRNAYLAARGAVNCSLSAADSIVAGRRLAYALVRPPGHHAERRAFGGFCYFNSAAIACHALSRHGTVCLLDIDFHHGNGSQDIYYERSDVLTVSIHGHPGFAYPYFSGFSDETGSGPGSGFNLNLPLGENIDGRTYADVLYRALDRIRTFAPLFLVVSLGLDTAKGDPTGAWNLNVRDFMRNGRIIGKLGVPTLVVQEGGYRIHALGQNARAFFFGMAESIFGFRWLESGKSTPRAKL